jgi:hypothetical protein
MCGCFGNMCTCIYCVLYCLYCVFCIVSFMYIYSYLSCLYWCKDYCHRVTTQLQLIIIIIIIMYERLPETYYKKLLQKLYNFLLLLMTSVNCISQLVYMQIVTNTNTRVSVTTSHLDTFLPSSSTFISYGNQAYKMATLSFRVRAHVLHISNKRPSKNQTVMSVHYGRANV